MNVTTIAVTSIDLLRSTLKEKISEQFKPTLAIGFSSSNFPFQEVLEIFQSYQIELIGCTTAGEIYNNEIVESSFSFLLLSIPPESFRITSFNHDDNTAISSGKRVYSFAKESFKHPGVLIFISGVKVVADGPVKGIREVMDGEIPIYGGLAGDDLKLTQTHVFTQKGFSDYGVAALVLDTEKVKMKGLAISGWEPLGPTHIVTKADQNIIYEIDNQPALDLFLNYFGDIDPIPSAQNGVVTIPGQYPLKIMNQNGSSYLRSLLTYDIDHRALLLAGEIKENTQFKFCPPPDFHVIEDTINQFQVSSISEIDPDALIMVSCKGRHTSFGPLLEDEIRSLYEIWQKPMAGFLSYGEIGNDIDGGACDFHNVTCALVTLTEI